MALTEEQKMKRYRLYAGVVAVAVGGLLAGFGIITGAQWVLVATGSLGG